MLSVNISGPISSGKGYLISAIVHKLRELGCEVVVQSETTHNAEKLIKTDEEISNRLKDVKIYVTEMQTSPGVQ